MRPVLVFGLLITLCASANAATVHHPRTRHHVVVRHNPSEAFDFAVPGPAYGPPPVYDTPGLGYYGSPSDHNSSQWGGQPD